MYTTDYSHPYLLEVAVEEVEHQVGVGVLLLAVVEVVVEEDRQEQGVEEEVGELHPLAEVVGVEGEEEQGLMGQLTPEQ